MRYVLRPPVAQERVELRCDGLVRIALERAYADGTVAVDMDPLSSLCRLATSVPPPRFHTVKYSGVLASASPWRRRIGPRSRSTGELAKPTAATEAPTTPRKRGGYRPWADLLRRTFGVDVLQCPKCEGRMRLLAMVTEPKGVARLLEKLGEPTDVPARSPSRGPPYWKSTVLRRKALEAGSRIPNHSGQHVTHALAASKRSRTGGTSAAPRPQRPACFSGWTSAKCPAL